MDNNNRESLKTRNAVSEDASANTVASAADLSSQRRKIIKASAVVVPALMTLRSGAAAALTSSAHRCLDKTGYDNLEIGTVDGDDRLVLGDQADELTAEGLPNDQLVRVATKQAKWLTYTRIKPNGKVSKPRTYFFIRIDNGVGNGPFPWTDLGGWHIYNSNGELLGTKKRERRLEDPDFTKAFKGEAITLYGVESVHTPGTMDIVTKPGDITPVVPESVIIDMRVSPIYTYAAAYVSSDDSGVIKVVYYPMPKEGDAVMINGSCLTSIAPAFQL